MGPAGGKSTKKKIEGMAINREMAMFNRRDILKMTGATAAVTSVAGLPRLARAERGSSTRP